MGIKPAKQKVGLSAGPEEGAELRQRIEPGEINIATVHNFVVSTISLYTLPKLVHMYQIHDL